MCLSLNRTLHSSFKLQFKSVFAKSVTIQLTYSTIYINTLYNSLNVHHLETVLQIVVDLNDVCIVNYDQMSHMMEICEKLNNI